MENYNNKTERFKALSDFAERHGKTWSDLTCELEFALQEMYGEVDGQRYYDGWISVGYTIEQFKQFTDVSLATEIFERSFERAGKPLMDKRKAYARTFYEKFTGTSISPVTPGISVVASGNQVEGWGTNPNGRNDFVIANFDESRWVESVPTKQMNQTAAEYITNVLCKYAMTNTHDNYEDETPGFKYYVTAEGHHFESINYNADDSVEKVNIEYGNQNSNVISFSISKIGSIAMLGYDKSKNNNSISYSSSALDYLSADIFDQNGTYVLGGNSSTDETNENTEEYTNWWAFRNKARPINVVSSSSETELKTQMSSTFNDLVRYSNEAELTVWGDFSNKYTAGGYVDIAVYGQGLKHYTSGIYMILRIQDSITSSGYTQTMKLLKNMGKFDDTNKLTLNELKEMGTVLLNDVSKKANEVITNISDNIKSKLSDRIKSGKTKN
jgi:hypothetical protein